MYPGLSGGLIREVGLCTETKHSHKNDSERRTTPTTNNPEQSCRCVFLFVFFSLLSHQVLVALQVQSSSPTNVVVQVVVVEEVLPESSEVDDNSNSLVASGGMMVVMGG